jgi:hypothetical protein
MIRNISILAILIIIGLNAWIYRQSEARIKEYTSSPPFFFLDFTKSSRYNSESSLKNLRDENPETVWVKEREGDEYDFELELKLSHKLENGIYKPRPFKTLIINSCTNNAKNYAPPEKIKVYLFLKEAINIDKELRLPNETFLSNLEFTENENTFPISSLLHFQDSDSFPKGIHILSIRAKVFAKEKTKACLSDVVLH